MGAPKPALHDGGNFGPDVAENRRRLGSFRGDVGQADIEVVEVLFGVDEGVEFIDDHPALHGANPYAAHSFVAKIRRLDVKAYVSHTRPPFFGLIVACFGGKVKIEDRGQISDGREQRITFTFLRGGGGDRV